MAAVEGIGRASDYVGNATHDLYRKYGKQIYAYCLHKLRSKEEAEDAVQTTFMNAFRSLQRGNTTEYEQAWLFKIAQNVCHARASSSSRRLRLEAPNDFEVLQEIVPAKDADDDSLELIGVEEALERMPENQRRAILLREWQGLSYKEIAGELGVTQTAVEMLIFRARRSLAGALEQPAEKKGGRVARLAGAFGSLAGALKTLLTGGAAIKAATVAAAAVAVVGEGASHTIVKRDAPAPRPARTVAAAPVAVVKTHSTPAARVAATADASVEVQAPARAATRKVEPVRAVHARPVRHAAPAPVAPAVAAPPVATPEPPHPVPAPAPAPTPAPAPAPAAPPEAKGKDRDRAETPAPSVAITPVAPEAPTDASGPGKGNGRKKDKEHGRRLQEQPVAPTPPVVTEPVVTEAAPPPVLAEATPAPAPAVVEDDKPGNGRGRDRDKTKRP